MCDCINKTEANIRSEIEKRNPDWDIQSALYMNQAYLFDAGISVIGMEFEVEYLRETKSGNKQRKTYRFMINGQFCPFCGKEIKELKSKEASDGNNQSTI
jgi:formamidopyrimidine-DNA glycosylase